MIVISVWWGLEMMKCAFRRFGNDELQLEKVVESNGVCILAYAIVLNVVKIHVISML